MHLPATVFEPPPEYRASPLVTGITHTLCSHKAVQEC